MTYDEFWNGDVRMVEYYRKANELKLRRENVSLWLQGRYIYEALCDASPLFRTSFKKGTIKPEPYLKEPYPITEEEVRERKEREMRLKQERLKTEFALFAARFAQKKMPKEAHTQNNGGDIDVRNSNRQSTDTN